MTTQNLGKLIHLKKLCTDNNHFQMLAVDQRPPIFNIITAATGRKYTYQEVVECKRLITFEPISFSDSYSYGSSLFHTESSSI